MIEKIKKHRDIVYEIFYVLLGSALFGGAVAMFITPGEVILGGATGIATTLHILWDLPSGVMMFCINTPLVLLGLKIFGFKFLWKTIIAVITTSFFTDFLVILPVTIEDPLLCAILGTAMLGAGAGILLARGYNTGGSDLAALMLKRKFKHLSTGNLIFAIDIFIIAGSALVTRNYGGIFYSILATYIYSFTLDHIIDGNKTAKMILIVSDKYDEISNAIFDELQRGVTILNGRGWYSKDDKNVVLCVIKRDQLYATKVLVNRVDPQAFMILTDAKEVMGKGFNALD